LTESADSDKRLSLSPSHRLDSPDP
jgi:hypothetical protein